MSNALYPWRNPDLPVILLHSNSPCMPTGYGQQMRVWIPTLKGAGYGLVLSAYRGREGGPVINEWGVWELPRVREPHVNDVIEGHLAFAQADFIFSLIDPFAMNPAKWKTLPWAAWTPIDCEPVLDEDMAALSVCRWPIAMSRFGEQLLRSAGFDPLMIPHGIETDVFMPLNARTTARQKLVEQHLIADLIPDDKFLVIIVANNGEGRRKNFSGMLEAFAHFASAHDDALLYIHADRLGVHGGQELDRMADQLGISNKVLFPQPYAYLTGMIQPNLLNYAYNAADVFLLLSHGEGFGLPLVEAQAAGLPVITTAFSANVELCFSGWLINGPLHSFATLSYQMIPDTLQAAEALHQAYQHWKSDTMQPLKEKARTGALTYDVHKVMGDYMKPALDTIASELKAGKTRALGQEVKPSRFTAPDLVEVKQMRKPNRKPSAYRSEIASIVEEVRKGR